MNDGEIRKEDQGRTAVRGESRYAAARARGDRRRRALTQKQLSEIAGVAHTTVQLLESLKRGGCPRTINKLASALGVEPEDLVDGHQK